VLAGAVELDEVGFLTGAEFGLFAAEASFGAGDGHAFAGSGAGEVGFDYVDTGLLSRILGAHRPT